jgi:iron(III) transport system permease protein
MALSTVFLAMIMVLIGTQWRLLRQKEFTTVTGRGFATRPARLGRLKYVTLAIALFYVFLATILPLAAISIGTFTKYFGYFGGDPWTLDNWTHVLGDSYFWFAMKNGLILAGVSATIGMVIYALISYIIVKTRARGRGVVDVLTWLPWGVPAMVLALGLLWAYIGGLPLKFLYGSMAILILVQVVIRMPFGVRVMSGGLIHLGKELEESARIHGASWFQTFRDIVVPLLSPAFISAWIVNFLMAFTDVASIIFLYSHRTMVLSVLIFQYWINGEDIELAAVIGVVQTFVVLVFALFSRWLAAKQEITTGVP